MKKIILYVLPSLKVHKMKIALLALLVIPCMSFISVLFEPIPPNGNTGSPCDGNDCTGCHSDFVLNTGAGTCSITSNIPVSGYVPGNTYSITATINYTGKSMFNFELSPQTAACSAFGVMTASAGTIIGGTTLKYIKGNGAKLTANTASWTFNWTAPVAGTGCGTFYACFNAANNSGDELGDYIYTKTLAACEAGPLGSAISNFTNVSCFSVCNGTATVAPSGGSAPYTYLWTPGGQTTAVATGLCAGNYTVTVTDALSATSTATVAITQPSAALSTAMSSTNQTNVVPDGTATSTPAGGTSPYTYSWAPGGQTTQTAVGLAAGTYTVTVTDAHGCTTTNTVQIISTVGVNSQEAQSEMSVYPNPSNGSLFVEINTTNNANYTLQLISLTGQIVYNKNLSLSAGKSVTTVATDGVEAGMYILQLSSTQGAKHIQVMIMK